MLLLSKCDMTRFLALLSRKSWSQELKARDLASFIQRCKQQDKRFACWAFAYVLVAQLKKAEQQHERPHFLSTLLRNRLARAAIALLSAQRLIDIHDVRMRR